MRDTVNTRYSGDIPNFWSLCVKNMRAAIKMPIECCHCACTLSTRSSLIRHQKTSKACLLAQGALPAKCAECPGCGKNITRKARLDAHMRSCAAVKIKTELESKHAQEIERLRAGFSSQAAKLNAVQEEKQQEYLRGRLDATRDIAESLIGLDIAQARVKALEKKYLRKQKRRKYDDKYVVYLITSKDLTQRRTYIVGSATCLESRLSTYNKTAEHDVIYYSRCETKENMKLLEAMVLKKLDGYRECANRDRFILPELSEPSLFLDAYKQGEQFLGLSEGVAKS